MWMHRKIQIYLYDLWSFDMDIYRNIGEYLMSNEYNLGQSWIATFVILKNRQKQVVTMEGKANKIYFIDENKSCKSHLSLERL